MLSPEKARPWLRRLLCALILGQAPDGRAADWPPAGLERIGLVPFAAYIGETFGRIGDKPQVSPEGLLEVGFDADLEKLAGLSGIALRISAIYPHGGGLTDDNVRDLNRFSNIDAFDSVRLGELWIEKAFGSLHLRFGQIAADQLFFLSDQAALFLNSGFGTPSPATLNFSLSIYPVFGLGGYVEWKLPEHWRLQVALFDAAPGTETGNNLHNLAFHWHPTGGISALLELERLIPDGHGRRIGELKAGWMWSQPDIEENSRTARRNGYMIYGIAERMLFFEHAQAEKEIEGLGAFVRACYSNGGGEITPFYLDAGVIYVGLIPGRNTDRLGLGASYLRLDESYVDREGLPNHSEVVVELTYDAVLGPHVHVQPDLQYIWHPGGRSADALLVGVRLSLQF
jgi:porin